MRMIVRLSGRAPVTWDQARVVAAPGLSTRPALAIKDENKPAIMLSCAYLCSASDGPDPGELVVFAQFLEQEI